MKEENKIRKEIAKVKETIRNFEDEVNEMGLIFKLEQQEKLERLLEEKFGFERVWSKVLMELFDIDYCKAIHFLCLLHMDKAVDEGVILMYSPKTELFYYIKRTVLETFHPITVFSLCVLNKHKMEEFIKEVTKKMK